MLDASTSLIPTLPTTQSEWVLLAVKTKSNLKWFGRTVYEYAMEASLLIWEGINRAVAIFQAIWEMTLPRLQQIATFLCSPTGSCALGAVTALALFRIALSPSSDDKPQFRSIVLLTGLFCAVTTALYGSEIGVIPHLFIR